MTQAAVATSRPAPRRIPVRFLGTEIKDGKRLVTCLIYPGRLERVQIGDQLTSGPEDAQVMWQVTSIVPYERAKATRRMRAMMPILNSAWVMEVGTVIGKDLPGEPLKHGEELTPVPKA